MPKIIYKHLTHVRYLLEATIAYILYNLAKLLPRSFASKIGSVIARTIGAYLPVHQRGLANLKLVLPEASAQHQNILKNVWGNLGSLAMELPHVHRLTCAWAEDEQDADVMIYGRAHLHPYEAKQVIFIAGHFANWEILGLLGAFMQMPFARVYRAANNPYVDRLIIRNRQQIAGDLIAKGRDGARELLSHLRAGKSLGLLVDQRLRDGVPIPFFGRLADTARAPAALAQKFHLPLIPVSCTRLPNSRFRVDIHPAILADNRSAEEVLLEMNQWVERQIRHDPSQWLWLHRRWPKSMQE